MIDILTKNPIFRFYRWLFFYLKDWFGKLTEREDKGGTTLKVSAGLLLVALSAVFFAALTGYRDAMTDFSLPADQRTVTENPSAVPIVWKGVSVFLALMSFTAALWVRETSSEERRQRFTVIALWIGAVASLCAWLPGDIIETLAAISGKQLAGEPPAIFAYLGQILLVSFLILSIPISAMLYFRLSLMDRYVVHSFLSPFLFCLFSFVSIWIIADLTDNGEHFISMKPGQILTFYIVQIPFVILFVMPIVVLLAGLFSLSGLSKTNEFISMIGAGRSVVRILMPLFVIGAYTTLISLSFKYEWAPTSSAYKEAIIDTAWKRNQAKRNGTEYVEELWSKRGWMHVNEVNNQTWFVGYVPLELSDPMRDVVVSRLDEKGQPLKIWIANRARWVWNADPAVWVLYEAKTYTYGDDRIPLIEKFDQLTVSEWNETPWQVLSSSQKAEFLGIPGLSQYLSANSEMGRSALASFRTNWWYIFAEPFSCFVMMLVAAPLGIVYSRRGGMGGVTGAILVFAFMYVMSTTMIALGQDNRIPPFWAAWITNIIITVIGLFLLWFRARNRDIPKLKDLFLAPFRRKRA